MNRFQDTVGSALVQPGVAKSHGANVSLEQLHMKIPGKSAAQARSIVLQAAELASHRLPQGLSGNLDRLELKVNVKSTNDAEISEAIASSLVSALIRGGRASNA